MPVFEAYDQGTPCWVDLATTDATVAKAFYSRVFGWDYEDLAMPGGSYSFATLNGHNVAAISEMSPEMAAQMPSVWSTYLAIDDADAAVARAEAAGGSVMMAPDDIPGSGRIAFIADPTGAAVGLWQADGHIGATLANEPGTVIWNECFTDDVEAAAGFYNQVVGTTHQTEDMGGGNFYTTLHIATREVPVSGLMARDPVAHADVPNTWSVYFAVDDLDEVVERINDGGGKVLNGPFDTPAGPMIVAADPLGAVFQAMLPGQ